MKNYKYCLAIFLFLLVFQKLSSQNFTISGFVSDKKTGESLIGSSVLVLNPTRGTTTNTYGFYSLTLEKGKYEVIFRFIGYKEIKKEINLSSDIRLNTQLEQFNIKLNEVVVSGARQDNNIKNTESGNIKLNVEQISSIPTIMGEPDILKTLQLKPGIQSGGEGTTGLFVRGGSPDQNLILLDEAVVYNASHLFGFFSVFNSDAIQNVEVHKGSMPATYGGRLASVIDISMREGNNQNYSARGGIGLISSRLTVEGPIIEDTSSFILSGRRTYIDVISKPFIRESSPFKNTSYYFYDLNTKFNYRLSDKDRFFFSAYLGRDVFEFSDTEDNFSNNMNWGNVTAVARWNHLFNHKLFVNTSIIYSQYNMNFDILQDDYEMRLASGIENFNFKVDFSYIPNYKNKIKFGANYINHTFTPSNISAQTSGVDLNFGPKINLFSHERAIYYNHEINLNPLFLITFGLRYSGFTHVGPFDRFIKDPANNRLIQTISYEKGEVVKDYNNIEPRFSSRYLINEVSSIKAGYTQNYQYLHLASLSSISLPTDVWISSTERVKPQLGNQFFIGYYRNFNKNMFEASVEVYYKNMKNQIEFKEGALIEDNLNNNIDNNLVFGTGTSYGIEFLLNKQLGRLTGWIGYTWSKTDRIFPDINFGKKFPAKFDRRHDVSLVAMYKLNDNIELSLVWVYATGNTTTLPISRYIIQGNIINEYSERNAFRLPPYHRMDISLNWTPKRKKSRKFESSWNFSIYNLYNRRNPYYIYFETEGNITQGNLEIKAKQVSLFPILPSITYNFKF